MNHNGYTNPEDESFSRGDPNRIAYLIAGYIQQTLTGSEHHELDEWVAESDDNNRLFGELTDEKNIEAVLAKMKQLNPGEAYQDLRQRIGLPPEKIKRSGELWTYAVAASVVVATSIAAYFFSSQPANHANTPAVATTGQDIDPGGNKATLTLSDGAVVALESVTTGTIKKEFGVTINKSADGELVYASAARAEIPVTYNTLIIPNGGTFKIVLSDGTTVWLNAASSLRYPVAFTGKQREVELTGEGYFEVASSVSPRTNEKRPFIVKAGNTTIEVLGTHFNVNAYENEGSIKTTLLEGSVRMHGDKESLAKVLKPGQQGIVTSGGAVTVADNISTDEVVAWKEGLFKFKDTDIKTIMRQVERWYNVPVVYDGEINGHFNATISRNVPVSKLLHYLQLTGHVAFQISNNKIIVSHTSQKEK
ncbi:MAG TPA: FecR domain-containing protein [Agriterribacter sp.]|nr:FecR domain-containing protein [Agriterribacter sp.]HRQ50465.1 FecR domain-containing protein [Agriterribacter sp.]